MRLAAERIASEDGKVECDPDGPDGCRLRLVEARQDPFGRHALERALELAKGLAAQPKVGRRAKVDDLDGVVLQTHQYVLGLDVAMHDALGEDGQADAYELREDLLEDALAE